MSSVTHHGRAAGAARVSRLFLRVSGLQPGDVGKALQLGIAHAAVLASLYILKPARNSLFLSRIGPAELPIVMSIVAVLGALTALALAAAAGTFKIERLMRWLLPALALSLIGWWLGLRAAPSQWLIGAFYIWVNLQGQLTTALLWLLVGAASDARQSRRVFAFVGALGIAGAVCGGAVTQQLAPLLGTVNLLPLCAIALLGARVAMSRISLPAPVAPRPRPGSRGMRDLRDSRLLRVLLLMTLLGAMATSIIDFQFNAAVSANLPNEDAKTAFFGSFFAYLNVGAFLFQLAFTSRLMARFGLGPSLLVLPTALWIGGGLAVLAPGLTTATLLKASDASLRHSLYRSAVELLFVPLPARVKQWFRVFLDAAVDNLGTGLGALCVLLLTANLGVNQRYLALLGLGIIALWVIATSAARTAHVDAFRSALEAHQLQPEELALDAREARVTRTVLAALDTASERQLNYILDLMLAAEPNIVFGKRLRELVSHSAAEIRAKALHALRRLPGASASVNARRLLRDPDGSVRREAAVLLARGNPQSEASALAELLADSEATTVAAALGAALELDLAHVVDVSELRWLLGVSGSEGEWARRELARVLGALTRSADRHALLAELASDSSPAVVRQAIRSAGQLMDPEMIDFLLSRLTDRYARAHAIEALAQYGPAIVPHLRQRLGAEHPLPLQLSMARVLGRIRHQAAVDCLLSALDESEGSVRHALLKSLNELRSRGTELRFESERVDAQLEREIGQHQRLVRAAAVHSRPVSTGEKLLLQALHEKRQSSLEHVFRLLGLRYLPSDMENAFIAVMSDHRRARAQATEFLDNLLAGRDKHRVLPLLEPEPPSRSPEPDKDTKRRSLLELMQGSDAWLRACAVYCAAPERRELIAVRRALEDPDLIVRETARLVLSRHSEQEAVC